jgi:hypothetical protein
MHGIRSISEVPGVLAAPYTARRSGVLHFVRDDERRSLRFRGGQIAYAATNLADQHLGHTLVHHGWLRAEDLSAASPSVGREGRRLGAVLVDSGLIEAARLDDALRLHARTVIEGLFGWEAGGYEFEEQDGSAVADADLGDPFTIEVLAGAARRLTDEGTIRAALGDLDRRLVLGDAPAGGRPLALTAADAFVLGHVDGARTAREIVALRPGDARERLSSILALLCVGMLEWSAPAAPADRPDRSDGPAPLTDPTPAPAIEAGAAVDVQDALERAAIFVAIDRNWEAIQILEKVLPHVASSRMERTARVLLARAYLRNPKWAHRAEGVLQTVVRADPANVDAQFLLGKLYLSKGLRHRGESLLRRVLELDPGHAEAAAELKALTGKPFFKKFFGR